MTSTYPARTVRIKEATLDEYDGKLEDILRGMLLACGCPTNIPVKKISYYDGNIHAKYRVRILLPTKLGMRESRPAGEARTLNAAYHIAILRAITELREHKTDNLLRSVFSHIPHMGVESDLPMDTYRFVRQHPHSAA